MVREHVVIMWCDWHSSVEDVQVALEGVDGLTIDLGLGYRELDLCKPCHQDRTWIEVAQLYATEGRPVNRATGRPLAPGKVAPPPSKFDPPVQASLEIAKVGGVSADQPCPWCRKPYAAYRDARAHILSVHTSAPDPSTDFPLECADRDCSFVATGASGLRLHMSRMHNVSVLRAYVDLRDLGEGGPKWHLWERVNANVPGK